jgi:hypothetical protein
VDRHASGACCTDGCVRDGAHEACRAARSDPEPRAGPPYAQQGWSTEPAAAAAATDNLARIGTLEIKSLELEQKVQQLLARTRDLEIQLKAYKMAQPVVLVGESEGGRWCAPECLLAPRDGYRRAVPFDYSVMTWFTRHGGTAHLRLPCLRVCASARVCVCTYAHAGVRVWFCARVCTRSRT